MESTTFTCASCGRYLSDLGKDNNGDNIPCPDCGSAERKIFKTLKAQCNTSNSLSAKAKDISGFVKQSLRIRHDIEEKTGDPVVVSVKKDRTNPDKTMTTHTVFKTVDKLTGYMRKIHEDVKIGIAKHRPKK